VGLVLSVIATSLAGILSNPLFTLATDSVTTTPILQAAVATTQVSQVNNSESNFKATSANSSVSNLLKKAQRQ